MSSGERQEMGRKGKEGVVAEFSKEKMAERLEHQYRTRPDLSRISLAEIFFATGGILALFWSLYLVYAKSQS